MDTSNYYYLGYIVKPIGNKGMLRVQLETDNPQYYNNLKEILVEIHDQLIPYPVKSIHTSDSNTKVEFKNIDSPELAKLLQGCTLYLPLSHLPKLKGNQFYYHEVIGFEVSDKNHGHIGKVQTVIDQTSQAILQIDLNGKEILIPVTDEIIKKVDRKKKQLEIDSPEGLIDIYL